MAKKYIEKIEQCEYCNHCIEHYKRYGCYCGLTKKTIEEIHTIPDWCPLEDWKE